MSHSKLEETYQEVEPAVEASEPLIYDLELVSVMDDLLDRGDYDDFDMPEAAAYLRDNAAQQRLAQSRPSDRIQRPRGHRGGGLGESSTRAIASWPPRKKHQCTQQGMGMGQDRARVGFGLFRVGR